VILSKQQEAPDSRERSLLTPPTLACAAAAAAPVAWSKVAAAAAAISCGWVNTVKMSASVLHGTFIVFASDGGPFFCRSPFLRCDRLSVTLFASCSR